MDGNVCNGHYQQREKEQEEIDEEEAQAEAKKAELEKLKEEEEEDKEDADPADEDEEEPVDDNLEEKKKLKVIWHSGQSLLQSAKFVKEIQALE